MIVIRLNSGDARNRLDQISQVVEKPRDMLAASAGNVARTLRSHFRDRDKAGNKLGGKRTHFWAGIANQTQTGAITDREADVVIGSDKFGLKLYGGTVTAKTPWPGSGFKLLTIAVHPIAYGRRASTLKRETGLKLVFLGNASGGVLAAYGEGQMQVVYVCTPSVTHLPDPNALPPGGDLEEAAISAAEEYLQQQIKASQPGQSTT